MPERCNLGLMLAAALAIAAPADAAIVNYNFSGAGTGTMALDNSAPGVYTLNSLDLTLGSGNFTAGNSGMQLFGGSNYLLGSIVPGCTNSLGAACSGVNSFWSIFNPSLSSQTTTTDWSQPGAPLHTGAPITITQVIGAVPEPSTWAMMLLGFGVIGLSFKRQRKRKLDVA